MSLNDYAAVIMPERKITVNSSKKIRHGMSTIQKELTVI